MSQGLVAYGFTVALAVIVVTFAATFFAEFWFAKQFLGKSKNLRDILDHLWVYLGLVPVFALSGIGIVANLGTGGLDQRGIGLALSTIAGASLTVAVARIIVVTHSTNVAKSMYFYLLVAISVGSVIIGYYGADDTVAALFDYARRNNFPLYVVALGGWTGLFTEFVLWKIPPGGIEVGEKPGAGLYVCKTHGTSSRIGKGKGLEACSTSIQGERCLFRKDE